MDSTSIYITPADSSDVFRYNMEDDRWERLPNCPYEKSGLVVMNNHLLSVGGCKQLLFRSDHVPTNKIFSFKREGKKWRENFRKMNVPRHSPALATHGNYLFVIGGYSQSGCPTATVEVYNEHRNTWSALGDLPHPLSRPSATLCGEELYVLSGGRDGEGYCCSLQEFFTSSHPIRSPPPTWTAILRPPVYWSTIASLLEEPVLIGGRHRDTHARSSTVYTLSQGKWVESGRLCSGRWWCLVSASYNKMVVVGGWGQSERIGMNTHTVEELSVV